MRKILTLVLVVLMTIGVTSVIQAQSWVTIPVGVLSFDGSDGQELGHLDSIENYLNGSSCIHMDVTLLNVVPSIDRPELMLGLNAGDARFGFNVLLLNPSQPGDWSFQFPVSAMRHIGKGGALEDQGPTSGGFDYMVIRGWGGVIATINSVQAAKDYACSVSSALMKPGDQQAAVETPFATLPLATAAPVPATNTANSHWCMSNDKVVTSIGNGYLYVTFSHSEQLTSKNSVILFVDGRTAIPIDPVWVSFNQMRIKGAFGNAHPTAIYSRTWWLQVLGDC